MEQDARGVVTAFHEKIADPPGNLANGTVYVFEPEIVERIAAFGRPIVDLSTKVIPHFLSRIYATTHPGYHRDIGNLASLAAANRDYPG